MKTICEFGINVYTKNDASFVHAIDENAELVNIKPFEEKTIEQFYIEKMKITDVVSADGKVKETIFNTGIFIETFNLQKFTDMTVPERVAFYAKAIGDENLEGFAIIVQDLPPIDDDGCYERNVYVFNNHMDELPNMRYLALSCHYHKVTFEQLSQYLVDGVVRGKEITISDFFD